MHLHNFYADFCDYTNVSTHCWKILSEKTMKSNRLGKVYKSHLKIIIVFSGDNFDTYFQIKSFHQYYQLVISIVLKFIVLLSY